MTQVAAERAEQVTVVMERGQLPGAPVRGWRIVAIVAGWAAFIGALWWVYAPNGYNTSDYGFIVGQSWRVLHGEIPHLDFISARPAGSAYLHVIDFALPLPLVEASRLVAITQSVLCGFVAAIAVLGRRPTAWSYRGHLVAAMGALITINTFQIGPWYTVDGLLFSLAAFAALRLWDDRGGTGLPEFGLLAAGLAPLFKQSFFLTPVIAAVWVGYRLWQRGQLRPTRVLAAAGWLALPGVVYLVFVTLSGGLGHLVSQLTSATSPNWLGSMARVSPLSLPARDALLLVVVLAIMAYLYTAATARTDGRRGLQALLGAGAFLASVGIALSSSLSMYNAVWNTRIWWLGVGTALIVAVARRSIPFTYFGIVAVGWMSVLSWGMDWPLLTAGATMILIAQALAEPTGDVLRRVPAFRMQLLPWTVMIALGLVMTLGLQYVSINYRVMHRDLPASKLSTPLVDLDADFGRVLTNPSTHQFLADAIDCVAEYPADGVVFGSWNSDLYAMLELRNPLATDGANSFEITGAEEQYRDSVRALAARGDFLVLFPLVNPETVFQVPLKELPVATTTTPIPEYWFTEVVPYSWMAEVLGGEQVACGTWIGFYEPASR